MSRSLISARRRVAGRCSVERDDAGEAVAREKEVQLAAIKEEDEHLTAVARNICARRFSGIIRMRCARKGSAECRGRS